MSDEAQCRCFCCHHDHKPLESLPVPPAEVAPEKPEPEDFDG